MSNAQFQSWHEHKITELDKTVNGNGDGGLVRKTEANSTLLKVLLGINIATLLAVVGLALRILEKGVH